MAEEASRMIYALLFGNAEHTSYDEKIKQLVNDISATTTAFGSKVTDANSVKDAIKRGEREIFIFAEGNSAQIGNYSSMQDFARYLNDDMGLFGVYGAGNRVTTITLQSCQSSKLAPQLGDACRKYVQREKKLVVQGVIGRAFTKSTGQTVGLSTANADELDRLVAAGGLSKDRYDLFLEENKLGTQTPFKRCEYSGFKMEAAVTGATNSLL
jgi:hypothetical protein